MTKTLAPLALAALLLPGLAAAHSALEASVPGPDETVTAPVAEIALNFRNAIRLTRIEGQTIRQAAATMKRSETATYQLLWRATKRLKEAFGDTASLLLWHVPPSHFGQ